MHISEQINKNLSSLLYEIEERDLKEKSAEDYADSTIKEIDSMESAETGSVIL